MANKKSTYAEKRTPQERERDLAFIARHYLRGWSQNEIANRISEERTYSLSQATISNEIKLLHEKWRESYLVDIDAVKAKELARLDELELAYWEGWQRSLRNTEDQEQSAVQDKYGSNQNKSYERKSVTKSTKQRDGHVDFLKGVERCIALRLKIFGLFNQSHLTVDWRETLKKEGFEESDVNEQFEQLVQFFASGDQREDAD